MTAAPTVSAVVLARDAARVIDDCLASLQWADEILVVLDSATTDDTEARSARGGARVERHVFSSFAEQRNAALDLAAGEWVFFVDSDERVTPALADEARRTVNQDSDCVGFWVPRRNIICGRWIRHAGWYPDLQLRLLRRGAARYSLALPVHEVAELRGLAGELREPLIHLNYRTLADFWLRQRRYARLAAEGMRRRGERPRARALLGQPAREFWRRFVTEQGYREGPLGLALCAIVALAAMDTIRQARSSRGAGVSARS